MKIIVPTLAILFCCVAPAFGQDWYVPVVKKICNPRYPAEAAHYQVEGLVKMQFQINKKGRAFNIVVIESDAEGIFDSAAVESLSCWKFEKNREPEKVFRQGIEFTLGNGI